MLDDDNQGKPLDPTDDAQGLMGDTTGLSGVSSDNDDNTTNRVGPTVPSDQGLSDAAYIDSLDKGSETEIVTRPGTGTPADTLSNNMVLGEQSVSGDMPDPSSDDDTLSNVHSVGQQLDEDVEHPQQLDVSRDEDLKEIANRQS
jgi:hypothetical protein